ncbi:hypothetical protein K491DRAFT_500356 [Lophiostoma macrostomum CBS 122681]|uniref:Uncharacterized protein n=1 Tax=Lophiostoma macrostomum CBS 122681 TaxID=1314788 RepID=A0A6A6T2A2_9PLEO|nr:hypothetical protein K491DRAFT_500356 [Lophiostoma macrostomum CBS 122681]
MHSCRNHDDVEAIFLNEHQFINDDFTYGVQEDTSEIIRFFWCLAFGLALTTGSSIAMTLTTSFVLGVIMTFFGKFSESAGMQHKVPPEAAAAGRKDLGVDHLFSSENDWKPQEGETRMTECAAKGLPLVEKHESKSREHFNIQWNLHLETHRAERYKSLCKGMRVKLAARKESENVGDQHALPDDLEQNQFHTMQQDASAENMSPPIVDSTDNGVSDDDSTPPKAGAVNQGTPRQHSKPSPENLNETVTSADERGTTQEKSNPLSQPESAEDDIDMEIDRTHVPEALYYLCVIPTPPQAHPQSHVALNPGYDGRFSLNRYTGQPRAWHPTPSSKLFLSYYEPGVWGLEDERNGFMVLEWVPDKQIWYCVSHGIALVYLDGVLQFVTGHPDEHLSSPEKPWNKDCAGPMWCNTPIPLSAYDFEQMARIIWAEHAERQAQQVAKENQRAEAAVQAAFNILLNKNQPQAASDQQAATEQPQQSAHQSQYDVEAQASAGMNHANSNTYSSAGAGQTQYASPDDHPITPDVFGKHGQQYNASSNNLDPDSSSYQVGDPSKQDLADQATTNTPEQYGYGQGSNPGASKSHGQKSKFFAKGQPKFTKSKKAGQKTSRFFEKGQSKFSNSKEAGQNSNANGKQHDCSQDVPSQSHQGCNSHGPLNAEAAGKPYVFGAGQPPPASSWSSHSQASAPSDRDGARNA